jgi:ribosomal protein L3 glutamine methyltransferase
VQEGRKLSRPSRRPAQAGRASVSDTPDAAQERLTVLATPRDWFRYAVSRFRAAGLVFGHGATNAVDEAAFLILEALDLPIDALDPFADARLLEHERRKLDALIEARVVTRKPAAYLLNRIYIQGVPFYVDERVIVPRSFIGELLFSGLVGEGGLIETPEAVESVLDLCTGGGSLALLAARVFPSARVDAVDLSPDALAVARRNVEEHDLAGRVTLIEGNLFAPLEGRAYDVILTNPPYVETAAVAAFPPEYAAEPALAHDGGADGLDLVRRIVGEARAHLNPDGVMICEIGAGRSQFEATFPDIDIVWVDTRESEGEVFFARAADLPAPPRATPARAAASPRPAPRPRPRRR